MMIEKIAQWTGLAALLTLIIYVLLPSRAKHTLHAAGEIFMSISIDLIETVYWCFAFCNGVLHIIGRLLTGLLLATATFILCREVAVIFLNPVLSWGEQYLAVRSLFTESYTWAAATTIVATTVAIANIRKYHLDKEDFSEKQRERREKRAAEAALKEKERREARKAVPLSFRPK